MDVLGLLQNACLANVVRVTSGFCVDGLTESRNIGKSDTLENSMIVCCLDGAPDPPSAGAKATPNNYTDIGSR